MLLHLSGLSDEPKEIHGHDQPWIRSAVESRSEAKDILISGSQNSSIPLGFQWGDVQLRVCKSHPLLVVEGRIRCRLGLQCSRCGEGFSFPVERRFKNLYTKQKEWASDMQHQLQGGDLDEDEEEEVMLDLRLDGSFHASDDEATAEEESTSEVVYLGEEYLDLGEILGEQLDLAIPVQPLCKEDCRGVCLQCSQNLNEGCCACQKLEQVRRRQVEVLSPWQRALSEVRLKD